MTTVLHSKEGKKKHRKRPSCYSVGVVTADLLGERHSVHCWLCLCVTGAHVSWLNPVLPIGPKENPTTPNLFELVQEESNLTKNLVPLYQLHMFFV